MEWQYDYIKFLAKERGCKVTDLIALNSGNDPFYVGTPSDRLIGEWFAKLWRKFGYGAGVHVRRVHYQIVSQDPPITMPNGNAYENTEACWDFLSMAAKKARYLGLVDPAAFVDRRNPDPVSYVPETIGVPEVWVWENTWGMPSLPDFPDLPSYQLQNFEGQQRYHIEVWAEKSTMNDVLLPLCERYGAVLQTGLGELSITATLAAVNRIQARNKPARIFYISDFDPAGQSMPVAVSRKIEYFMRSTEDSYWGDTRLYPIVLTQDQVADFGLPRTPIKETERRAGAFEARFGTGAVELDALEALHPGELDRIVSEAIDHYYDHSLDERVEEERERLREAMHEAEASVNARHAETITRLRDEYDTIRSEFAERVRVNNEATRELFTVIGQDLEIEKPDIEEYPIPGADDGDDLDEPLYDSQLEYTEQIGVYKTFQGREVVA
jgi:hypothetical protein